MIFKEKKMKNRKKMKKKPSKANVVFFGACAVAALVMFQFLVPIPLINSASTVGNIAGVFLAMGTTYGIFAAVRIAARKYKEASE